MKKKLMAALCVLAMGNATHSADVFALVVRSATAIALLAQGHQTPCPIKSGFNINEACKLFHERLCQPNVTSALNVTYTAPIVECFWNCPDVLSSKCVERRFELRDGFCYKCDNK